MLLSTVVAVDSGADYADRLEANRLLDLLALRPAVAEAGGIGPGRPPFRRAIGHRLRLPAKGPGSHPVDLTARRAQPRTSSSVAARAARNPMPWMRVIRSPSTTRAKMTVEIGYRAANTETTASWPQVRGVEEEHVRTGVQQADKRDKPQGLRISRDDRPFLSGVYDQQDDDKQEAGEDPRRRHRPRGRRGAGGVKEDEHGAEAGPGQQRFADHLRSHGPRSAVAGQTIACAIPVRNAGRGGAKISRFVLIDGAVWSVIGRK